MSSAALLQSAQAVEGIAVVVVGELSVQLVSTVVVEGLEGKESIEVEGLEELVVVYPSGADEDVDSEDAAVKSDLARSHCHHSII